MGWLYGWDSKKELVDHLVDETQYTNGTKFVAHSLRGNVLWTLADTNGEKWIGCILLGKSNGRWGYKDMDEASGPYYYSCPLGYLKQAPVKSQEWRDGVAKWHATGKAWKACLRDF